MSIYDEQWRFSGARRVPRPTKLEICSECEQPLGTSYPECQPCFRIIEDIWLADWAALLEHENIEAGSPDEALLAAVVMQETERHPWTVVDISMTLLKCGTCGSELGSRYQECGECGIAFGSALVSEFGATMNEHALHVGRWILRHPHQHSANILTAWRISTPRVLTGWLPSTDEAQAMMNLIKAGKVEQVRAAIQAVDKAINTRKEKA